MDNSFQNYNGFDQYGNDQNSVLNNPSQVSGIQFEAQYNVNVNKIRIHGLIGTSAQAVTNASTIPTGNSATLLTQLTPTQRNNVGLKNMAIPYVAIYEGTGPVSGTAAGSAQLYPKLGSGETAEKCRFYAGFDWHNWSQGSTMTSLFSVTIYNNSGTNIVIYAITQWDYIQNNGGTST